MCAFFVHLFDVLTVSVKSLELEGDIDGAAWVETGKDVTISLEDVISLEVVTNFLSFLLFLFHFSKVKKREKVQVE